MTETKTKTQSVTNTQLATAVLAAFLAGGLAFAAAPAANPPAPVAGACVLSEASIVYTHAINGTRQLCPNNGYWGARFSCTDRKNDTVNVGVGNPCVTQEQILAMARNKCRDNTHMCVPRAAAAPVQPPVLPPVPTSTPVAVAQNMSLSANWAGDNVQGQSVQSAEGIIAKFILSTGANNTSEMSIENMALNVVGNGFANANQEHTLRIYKESISPLNLLASAGWRPNNGQNGTGDFPIFWFTPFTMTAGSAKNIIVTLDTSDAQPDAFVTTKITGVKWRNIVTGEISTTAAGTPLSPVTLTFPGAIAQNMSLSANWAGDNIQGLSTPSPEGRIAKFVLSASGNNTADISIDNFSFTIIGEGFSRVGRDHTLRLYKDSVMPENLLASAGWQPNNGQNGTGDFPGFWFTPFTMTPGSAKNIIVTLDTSDAQVDTYLTTRVNSIRWHNVTTNEISTTTTGIPLSPVTLTF